MRSAPQIPWQYKLPALCRKVRLLQLSLRRDGMAISVIFSVQLPT